MKICCITILILINSWFCFGQNQLFNSTFDIGVADGWTDIIYQNDSVFLTGSVFDASNSGHRLFSFFKLNNQTAIHHHEIGMNQNISYYSGLGKTLIYDNVNYKVYLPGSTQSSGNNANGYFMVSNVNGDSLNTVTYSDSTFIQASLINNSKDQLIFSGATGVYNPNFNLDARLMKCDTSGSILWEETFGGNSDDNFYSLDRTHDEGYVMAGYTESWGAGGWDAYVVKTDSLGNFEWQEYFGDVNNDNAWVEALDNGDLLIYGNTGHPQTNKSRAFVRKLDSLGSTKWEQIYVYDNDINHHHQILSCEVTNDGYIFAGSSFDSVDNTPLGWVLKTDFDGNELWSRRYRKRDSQNYLRDIIELPNGDLMACGFVFAEGPLTQDAWLLRLNCLGFDSIPEAQGTINTLPDYEVMLENESINWGNCIINWGDGTSDYLYEGYSTELYHTYPNDDIYDIELIALACDSSDTMFFQVAPTFTGLEENETMGTFSMYPNPTNNIVTVQYTITNPQGETNVSLYDLTGRILSSDVLQKAQGSFQLNTQNYPNGIYLVVLSDENGRHKTGKLVVRH